jgi:hypothetical protein
VDLTLGVLSWGQHKTLKNTLNSYLNHGLLNRQDTEYLIFFQEFSEEDRHIADFFGFDMIASPTNVGIAEGYKELVKEAKGEYFLFLENDWVLRRSPWGQLVSAICSLATGEFDVVRFRDRKEPGNPLWTRQFEGNELSRPEHLLDCVHWKDDPTEFPQIYYSKPFWYTTSKYANWTNNPTMFKRDFLLEVILPRMGNRDVEIDIQQWWQEQDYWVAQGEGLFTHYRL